MRRLLLLAGFVLAGCAVSDDTFGFACDLRDDPMCNMAAMSQLCEQITPTRTTAYLCDYPIDNDCITTIRVQCGDERPWLVCCEDPR